VEVSLHSVEPQIADLKSRLTTHKEESVTAKDQDQRELLAAAARMFAAQDMYFMWANQSNGLWEFGEGYNSDQDVYDYPLLVLQYPAATDNAFVDGWGASFTVMGTSVSVEVEAGTFNCVHYQSHDIDMAITSDLYLAPNIGPVQFVTSNATMSVDITLTSYSLN